MEAVPRLHMLRFPSKISPEGTSFANLKRVCYEFHNLITSYHYYLVNIAFGQSPILLFLFHFI